MKLFLTSAGLPSETTEAFLKLLGKKPEEAKTCFIATAADLEKDKWFVEKDRRRLLKLRFKITEIDLKQENEESLNEKLKDFDVVFVEGGNTFYLMKYIRESGFDKAIKLFLDRGGIYLGVSAGSYVAGPDISPAQWKHMFEDKNIVHLKNLSGLNLVPFSVSPHFIEKDRKLLEKKSKEVDYPIIALNDKQAIVVCGSKVKIIDKGKKVSFYGKNPLSKQ